MITCLVIRSKYYCAVRGMLLSKLGGSDMSLDGSGRSDPTCVQYFHYRSPHVNTVTFIRNGDNTGSFIISSSLTTVYLVGND